jgi:hypothetical protein
MVLDTKGFKHRNDAIKNPMFYWFSGDCFGEGFQTGRFFKGLAGS